MVDLHVHTRCSDGGLAPAEAVAYAAERGLAALAITDHDTIAGNDEALRAGEACGLTVLPGVEISTWRGDLTFHMLGYGLTRRTPLVERTFAFLEESRRTRNPRMAARLQQLGVDITIEEVRAEAEGGIVGRPHFARVLLRKGVVGTFQEAFDRFLGRGRPGYVDKERLTPGDACRVIQQAGGVAVLAHPGLVEAERPAALPGLLEELRSLGLQGLEVYYSTHSPDQVRRYGQIARQLDLVATGGSDFHRPGEGGPDMGVGFGGLRVPDACLRDLQDRIAGA